jgi:tripartite-type tricarboxylate transporter receptor subunit TctC
MKKLLMTLIMSLSLGAYATETVEVVWPFALGNNQANIIRVMIDNANKSQTKYQFVFVSKQGAGGIVAANYVLASTKTVIFANSSSFYLTPLFNKQGYEVDQFAILSRMCIDRPLVMFSKNINKLTDKEVTVSVTPATIQALVPLTIKQKTPSFRYIEVPFKSGPDGTIAMLSGVVDVSVDWLGASTSVVTSTNGVGIVGITGIRNINNLPLLPGTDSLTGDVFLFLPKSVDNIVYKELFAIFQNSQSDQSDTFCKNDFGRPTKTEWASVNKLHSENKTKWQKLATGVVPQ